MATEEAERNSVPEENTSDGRLLIQSLPDTEQVHESPVDINITHTKEIQLPPLQWYNFELQPKKMKLTNTGYTCKYMKVLNTAIIFS